MCIKVASLNSTASKASAEPPECSPLHISTVTDFSLCTASFCLDRAQQLAGHVVHLCRTRSFIERLARSTLEGLAEHEQLDLVIDGKHTGTGNTTENVGTSTLEQRSNTLCCNDLATGIQGRLVLDGLVKCFSKCTLGVKGSQSQLTSPEVIIIRLRIVSRGYEQIPAPVVTVQPRKKEARKLPSRLPTRRTGLRESYIPKYRPR